ncbi:hypothetical protein M8C21_002439, partial [Ambrosia artemisiifolia]
HPHNRSFSIIFQTLKQSNEATDHSPSLAILLQGRAIISFNPRVGKTSRQAAIKTSWTESNPGLQFYTCSAMVSRCSFFAWVEPLLCNCTSNIIKGLVNSRSLLEMKVKDLKSEVAVYEYSVKEIKDSVKEIKESHAGYVKKRDLWLIISWMFFVVK